MRSMARALAVLALAAPFLLAQPVAAPAQNRLPPPGAPAAGFADLAERLLPAVVNISTTQTVRNDRPAPGQRRPDAPQAPPGSPFEEFFREFFERGGRGGQDPSPRRASSLGSGFVIDPSGIVVTNSHVVGEAEEIKVILQDNTELAARLLGRDTKTDLAVLKVETPRPLPSVSFGNSDSVRIGRASCRERVYGLV